mmetsp:Transcript_137879/g.195104  ORF Transcript_137879/g.195104 Transcript_137879/m.195104 type:complete len:291 (+) Transcript_137879:29-901(+)
MKITSEKVTAFGFVCLVSCIYILRTQDASPSRFLAEAVVNTYESVRVLATGDATTKKNAICGDINPKEAFSSAERSQSESFQKQLENLRGGNPLKTFITEGKGSGAFVDEYLIPLIPFAAGWIVGFAISFLAFWVCCCNWCCMHGCCKCCAKGCFKCCGKPKTKKRENVWWIGGLVLMTGVVSVSIAGLVFMGRFVPALNKFLCTNADFLATAHDGVVADNWIGVSPAVDSVQNINNNFGNIKGNLSSISNSFTDMDTKLTTVLTAVDNMYTTSNGLTVTRGDPRETTAY